MSGDNSESPIGSLSLALYPEGADKVTGPRRARGSQLSGGGGAWVGQWSGLLSPPRSSSSAVFGGFQTASCVSGHHPSSVNTHECQFQNRVGIYKPHMPFWNGGRPQVYLPTKFLKKKKRPPKNILNWVSVYRLLLRIDCHFLFILSCSQCF